MRACLYMYYHYQSRGVSMCMSTPQCTSWVHGAMYSTCGIRDIVVEHTKLAQLPRCTGRHRVQFLLPSINPRRAIHYVSMMWSPGWTRTFLSPISSLQINLPPNNNSRLLITVVTSNIGSQLKALYHAIRADCLLMKQLGCMGSRDNFEFINAPHCLFKGI